MKWEDFMTEVGKVVRQAIDKKADPLAAELKELRERVAALEAKTDQRDDGGQ